MTRYLNIKSATALLIVGAALATWSAAPTFGQSTGLHLLSSSIVSEFPGGFRITAEATGDKEIEAIVVHLQMGQVTSGTFDYLCTPSGGNGQLEPGKCEELKPAKLVKGELFWRTDRSVSYLPPGTSIRYYFDIQDVDGGKLVTEEQVFIYYDARYEWSEVSDGDHLRSLPRARQDAGRDHSGDDTGDGGEYAARPRLRGRRANPGHDLQ